MTNKKLIKSTGIIGSATMASRVLGFIRDILFAKFFGTNIFAQAFVVAFRLPNMLRDMVGEGATNAAIVPILTEYKHAGSEKEYWKVAHAILNLMLVVIVPLSIAGVIFAPLIVRIIAPGFISSPEQLDMTITLTRMLFPYIFFLGMVAYSKGVLNSCHYFTTPALSPVVLNTSIILSLFTLCGVIGVKGLVAGVLIGGFFEVFIQLRPLKQVGFKIKPEFNLTHPVIKRIGRLLVPRALGTAVYQMSVLIDTALASFGSIVGFGAPAALYFSYRLIQLPIAVFGISLATAVLPKMTKEAFLNDIVTLRKTVSFSLRAVFMVMLPAAVGLMIMAKPIIRILFQRGEFTAYSTSITVSALFFYSFGLMAYAGIKILVSTYYSMGDTKTPVKTAAISLVINLVLNLILMWPLKIGGLALATSIAAMFNFVILYIILSRRIGDIGIKELAVSFSRVLTASLIMGTVTFMLTGRYLLDDTGGEIIGAIVKLGSIIIISAVVYIGSGYVLKIEGIRKLATWTGALWRR